MKYKTKKTKKLILELRPYWLELRKLEQSFIHKVIKLEKKMAEGTKIDDIEFLGSYDYHGIGNVSRTMEMVDEWDLEMQRNTTRV